MTAMREVRQELVGGRLDGERGGEEGDGIGMGRLEVIQIVGVIGLRFRVHQRYAWRKRDINTCRYIASLFI